MVVKSCIISSLAVFTLPAGSALAAEAPEDVVARCAANVDLSARVACLEQALLGVPESAAAPSEAATVAVLPQPTVREDNSLGAEQVAARTSNRNNNKSDNERSTFNVTSSRTVPYKKLEVTLENGQVWVQINGDTRDIYVPKRFRDSMTVEIWRASLGGYKMRLNEIKRTIRVRRVE